MFCQSCLIRKNICFIKSFSLLFATPDEVLFCNIISNNHVQYMSQNGKAKGEKVNHVSSKKQLFDGKPFSAKKAEKKWIMYLPKNNYLVKKWIVYPPKNNYLVKKWSMYLPKNNYLIWNLFLRGVSSTREDKRLRPSPFQRPSPSYQPCIVHIFKNILRIFLRIFHITIVSTLHSSIYNFENRWLE